MADALALYLEARFNAATLSDPSLGKVRVLPEWPAPDERLCSEITDTEKWSTVSITFAGERGDTNFSPELEVSETTPKPQTLLCTFVVAVCEQRLQLDVWARTAPERGTLEAYLDEFLRAGTVTTLSDPFGSHVGEGLLLPLAPSSGFTGKVDFDFEGPRPWNEGDKIRQFEARSTIRAKAEAALTVKATTKKLARLIVRGLLTGVPYQLEVASDAPPSQL